MSSNASTAQNDQESHKKLQLYLAETFMNLGNVYKARGKYEKAEKYYDFSQKHVKKAFVPKDDKKKKQKEVEKPVEEKKEVSTMSREERVKTMESEAIKRLQKAKQQMDQDKAKFEQWQNENPQTEQNHGYVSGFFSGIQSMFQPKKQTTVDEIGVPINVTHEGHIGFDKSSGGFQTRNLPQEYQLLFDNLNQTLKAMGVSGITEKEAKLLLRSIPVVMAGNKSASANNMKSSTITHTTTTTEASSSTSGSDSLKTQLEKLKKEKLEWEKQKKNLESEITKLKSKLGPGSDLAMSTSPPPPPPPTTTTTANNTTTTTSTPPPPPPPPAPSTTSTNIKITKVTHDDKPPTASKMNSEMSNSMLLESIRKPQTLRKVDKPENKMSNVDADDQNVLNMIAKALINRRKDIGEDEPDGEDDNLDEWMD